MNRRKITTLEQTINSYDEIVSDYLLSEKHFNSNGHLVLQSEFDEHGEIVSKQIFEVDEIGNVLVQMNYERDNSLIERTEFLDDGNNYHTEITTSSGQKTFYEYQYTQLGNVDRIIIKNEDGHIEAFELFVMNDNGQIIEEVRQNDQAVVEFKKVLDYNGDGALSTERYYDRDVL